MARNRRQVTIGFNSGVLTALLGLTVGVGCSSETGALNMSGAADRVGEAPPAKSNGQGSTDTSGAGPAQADLVELLSVVEESGTVPSGMSLRLSQNPSIDATIERIEVESRIYTATNQMTPCLRAGLTLLRAESATGTTPPQGAVVAGRGDVVSLPIVHDVTLAEGVYVERVRVELALSGPPHVADSLSLLKHRYFKVVDARVKPIGFGEFEASMSSPSQNPVPGTGTQTPFPSECIVVAP
jgi:hypothetical protein